MRKTFLVLFLCSWPFAALAEPMDLIIPIYGVGVRGNDATWRSHILINNPQDVTVVVTVTRILPAITEACTCPGVASVTVPPRDTRSLETVFINGQNLILGAAVLSASAPVRIDSWIDRVPYVAGPVSTQIVEPVTDWFPAGGFVWVPRVFGGLVPETTNLFLINPNAFTIAVHYGGLPTVEDVEVMVPPNSMVLRSVIFQPFLTGAPAQGVRLLLSSSDRFFGLTSSGFIIRNPVVAVK